MKKIFCQLCCLVLLLSAAMGVSSCSNDGEIADKGGFYSYSFSFFHPNNIAQDYEFSFNGEKGSTGMVSRDTPEGILKVIEKESGKTVFEQQISLAEICNIQLIKIGEEVLLYSPEKFIAFTPAILYSGDASQYSAWFNGQELHSGELNYLSVDKLNGKLEIRMAGKPEPVFSKEMTIEAGDMINLMQVSDKDFIEVPEDTEPEPTEDNKCKVRFYYPAGIFTDINTGEVIDSEEIRIDLYTFDEYIWMWDTPLECKGSVTVKKGEISDYVELTFTISNFELTSCMYSITDTATDQKHVDYLTDFIYLGSPHNVMPTNDPATSQFYVQFKKVTFQLTGRTGYINEYGFNVLEGLTTRREL